MIRIGISGWTYPGWRDVFYPKDLAHARELEFASRAFDTIEINGTHYSLQRPSTFESWCARTPGNFVFSVKASRYITHMKQLRGVETALANFFASGVLALEEKLGPILWQLPPRLTFDEEKMGTFFSLLPHDTKAAARLSKRHDDRLKEEAWTRPGGERALRHCIEVRHPSFLAPEFFALLRKHRVAWVMADTGGRWPYAEDLTADFVYIRLHGPRELYASGYDDPALDWWAARIDAWSHGGEPNDATLAAPKKGPKRKSRDVFVYFDNDVKARAPENAKRLREKLHVQEPT